MPTVTPLSQRQIRERAATRHNTVGAIVRTLVREGRIHHDAEGRYSLVISQSEKAAPPDAANATRPQASRGSRFAVPPTPRGSREPPSGTTPKNRASGSSNDNASSDRPMAESCAYGHGGTAST